MTNTQNSEGEFIFKCGVCNQTFRHAQHIYEGHKLQLYGGIFACEVCWSTNHDGWAKHHEKVLLAHLESKGLPIPQRNARSLLPRE